MLVLRKPDIIGNIWQLLFYFSYYFKVDVRYSLPRGGGYVSAIVIRFFISFRLCG
jgi:hypothetical protein